LSRRLPGFAAIGFALGLAAGAILWETQMRRSRRDLFSSNPVRRLAALGYLGGGDRASSRLLRDYVRWERTGALRRRGEDLLRRIEHSALPEEEAT
jgi:hypothetical protein